MHKENAMSFKDQALKEAVKVPAEWLKIHLAHRALGMADSANQFEMGQKREQEAWEMMKQASGMKPTSEQKSANDDDMGTSVIIGDQRTEQHIYNHQPSTTLGKFAKAAALGAAILGAGGVGCALTLWKCGAFEKKDPAPAVKIELPEPDGYGFRILPDDEAK